MPATTIHLIRHGEVYNPEHVLYERLPDFPLSKRGVRMAQATARYVASHPGISQSVAVFSSPLDRTRETAGEILKALNSVREERQQPALELTCDQRIIEAGNEFRGKRIGHGEGALWRPQNLRLIRNLYMPTWGESYEHIGARMSDFVYEKVDQFAGQQVIAVSHESPIWSFRHLMETGHAAHWMFLRKTALASVTSFTFDSDTHELIGIAYADPAAEVQ